MVKYEARCPECGRIFLCATRFFSRHKSLKSMASKAFAARGTLTGRCPGSGRLTLNWTLQAYKNRLEKSREALSFLSGEKRHEVQLSIDAQASIIRSMELFREKRLSKSK